MMLIEEEAIPAEVREVSEEMAAMWISAFLDEIDRVETFFTTKLEETINHFITMQDRFRLKSEYY